MRLRLSLLLGLLFLPLAANPADTIPDDKAVIQFQTKSGVVTFNHYLHATLRVTECNVRRRRALGWFPCDWVCST